MGLALSTDSLSRLEACTRALVAPLAFDSVAAWQQAAMESLAGVVGAEGGTFFLPEHPHAVRGLDASHSDLLDLFCAPACSGAAGGPDPLLEAAYRAMAGSGLEVMDLAAADHALGGTGMAYETLFYHEVLVPARTVDAQSLLAVVPGGIAHLTATCLRRAPEPGAHLAALRVVYPAFRAGLETLGRLGAHRAALDAVDEPLAAFGADGVEVHRTPALRRLLAAAPEAARVERALAEMGRRLRPLAFARRGDAAALAAVAAAVPVAGAGYTLRAALLPPEHTAFGEAYLVTVTPTGVAAALPTAEALRARHGLTKREAEVALLVAEGLSNDAIAERLFVSGHTVRHHVEGAMAKLDLTGRGREAVAARLLDGAEVAGR